MSGFSGKNAWLAVAKQSAKGTVASTASFKNAFSGGNIGPARETDRLAETDSGLDQGAAYVTTAGVEGSPEIYVRDASLGLYLLGGMGTKVTSGTTNYTHTFTPGPTLPYMTFWKNVGGAGALWESYQDCQISTLTFAAAAGAPLTLATGIQGIVPTRLVADPASGVTLENAPVYNFNNADVTLGGSATQSIRSFELTVENNIERQQTDNVIPYDLARGQREISLSFDIIFENIAEYSKFHYGGAAGTAVSPTIFATSAAFTFTFGVNNTLTFTLPSIAYQEFPIAPDPSGSPIVVSVRAVAQKAVGTTDLLTVVLLNQTATY